MAYIDAGTNIPKVLRDPLKARRVDNQNKNYNRLWHEKMNHDYLMLETTKQ